MSCEFLAHATVEANRSGVAELQQGLSALGLEWMPPAANFLTFDLRREARPVYEALLHEGSSSGRSRCTGCLDTCG